VSWASSEGLPYPLGVSWCPDERAYNFALYSKHATDVRLLLFADSDLFPDDVIDAYHAYQSVNHVTCHDGFTLYDLVAYEQRRNLANGHGNTDGPGENWSSNCGWEGDDGAPSAVLDMRERQAGPGAP